MAGSRVLVQEGIYDEFVKKITEKAKSWAVGDPFDPNVKYGPQVIIILEDLMEELHKTMNYIPK